MMKFEALGPEYNHRYQAIVGPHLITVQTSTFNDLGPIEYRVDVKFNVGTPRPLEHSFHIHYPHSWDEEPPFLVIETQLKQVLMGITLTIREILLSPEDYSKSTFWEKLGNDL